MVLKGKVTYWRKADIFCLIHRSLCNLRIDSDIWINMSTDMPGKFLPASLLLTILIVGVSSCGSGNQPSPTSQTANSVPAPTAPPLTGFEKDLDYVRKGQYTYVWVFSRKDGKPLDKEDAAYLRTNAPQVVDWVTTDGGKKVIAGTNFDLAQGNLELLKKRFVVEDYTGR
jgi:hypothetical protein